MKRQIHLYVSEQIYRKLRAQLKIYAFDSVQEVIIDALREKYFRQLRTLSGGKRGRPRKLDEFRIMARKKIFRKGW